MAHLDDRSNLRYCEISAFLIKSDGLGVLWVADVNDFGSAFKNVG